MLVANQYEVTPQLKIGAFRIDLVVKDPRQPGRYMLAVECDGASYHSSAYARERDRLRQERLEALGWCFHRIWSTDWFHHRDEAVQRLLAACDRAMTMVPEPNMIEEREEP